ncbi:hypothetical protein B0H14DRAFT_2654576 [Mycena olivaceomarginata]|nr:hypothetical protein B0H14DRAFT_2654576 [Mycena olivaceomarginata]
MTSSQKTSEMTVNFGEPQPLFDTDGHFIGFLWTAPTGKTVRIPPTLNSLGHREQCQHPYRDHQTGTALDGEACERVWDRVRESRVIWKDVMKRLWGRRVVRCKPLTEDDLYLDEAHPDEVSFPNIFHTCGVCLNINRKSHPVSLSCEDSACYVCIRIWLETEWGCPQCGKKITKPPVPDLEQATAIVQECGDAWDKSRADYNWDGLRFPHI